MMWLRVSGLAAVIAFCTWFSAWWCVPVIAAAWALVRRTALAPIEAGLGALLGWTVLLLVNVGAPAFAVLLNRLGGVFPVPGAIVLLIALLFAGLLAWSAGRLVVGLVGTRI